MKDKKVFSKKESKKTPVIFYIAIFFFAIISIVALFYFDRVYAYAKAKAKQTALNKLDATYDIWETNYDKFNQKIMYSRKYSLMLFSGTKWCQPCIDLRQNVLASDFFKNYAERNLELLLIDIPEQESNQNTYSELISTRKFLASKYNISFVPYIIIFNSDGKVLGRLVYEGETAEEIVRQIDEVCKRR